MTGSRETDEELALRLGVTLGLDYGLPTLPPVAARLAGGTIITTTNPGGPAHSWVRDLFIEKDNHTMSTTGQTTINFDQSPAARRTDLGTSHTAAASVRDASTVRSRVWVILRSHPDGLTHEQLIEAYRMYVSTYGWTRAAPQSIRSRTKELERDGMVRHNEHATDKTKAGRLTHRWYAITDPNEQKRRREAAEATATPTPEQTRDLVGDLAYDIQQARRVGAFMAKEMAQYLVDQGWTRTPKTTSE